MQFPINRYPIFATWCYVVAKRMGYSEEEAKSLAVTRAVLGSAAKAGRLGGGSRRTLTPAGSTPTLQAIDAVPFVGMRPYVVTLDTGEVRGALHQAGRLHPVAPRDYDRGVIAKLGPHYDLVLHLLEQLADCYPAATLNSQAYALYERFAPRTEDGQNPRWGQRGIFRTEAVEQLIRQVS